MRNLDRALQNQQTLNERKNLLHSQAEQLMELDPTFLAALEELITSPTIHLSDTQLDEISTYAANALIERIYSTNQYIQIDSTSRALLSSIYRESWLKLKESNDIELTLRDHHYPRLRSFLGGLYPQSISDSLRSTVALGQVTSSEYSADFQMRLLRIEPLSIKEPILDIGCGKESHLVRYLRSLTLEAFGIDRSTPQGTDYLLNADWFTYDLSTFKWGTIISNLSFANHAVYASRYDRGQSTKYIDRYTEILSSLAPGGSFTYAPAVDYLESAIDSSKFTAECWSASKPLRVARVTKNAL